MLRVRHSCQAPGNTIVNSIPEATSATRRPIQMALCLPSPKSMGIRRSPRLVTPLPLSTTGSTASRIENRARRIT